MWVTAHSLAVCGHQKGRRVRLGAAHGTLCEGMEGRGPQEQRRGLQGQETQEPQTSGISTGRGELAQPRGAEAETRAGGPKSLSLVGGQHPGG